MTKFADELFADLMRAHGPALDLLDQQVPAAPASQPRRVWPGRARPPASEPRRPRRPPGWLAPVAAAASMILAVGLAVEVGGHLHHPGRKTGGATAGQAAEPAYVIDPGQGTATPISPVTGKLGKPVAVVPGVHQPGSGSARAQALSIWQDLVLPGGTINYAMYFTGHGRSTIGMLRRTSLVTGAAGRPIRLGNGAQKAVITPDGRTAYVTYLNGENNQISTVRPVSLATGTVGKPVLRVHDFCQTSMTPDGRAIYVVCPHQGTVTPISTATNSPGKPIRLHSPEAVGFTPSGRTAFVLGAGTVTPVSTATNTPGRTITAAPTTAVLRFAPDGKTVYAINNAGTSVTPFSVRTGRAGQPIPVRGIQATANMLITPDGTTIYISSFDSDNVTPVSVARHTADKTLTVPGSPLNIVITPDGRTVYASSAMVGSEQTVTPISIATNTVGKPIRITTQRIEVVVPGEQNPY